jgi:N utilization substance protein B
MAQRRKAREAALQLLYQKDLNADISEAVAREMLTEILEVDAYREFAWELYSGTLAARADLDEQIQAVAENWSLLRMAPTDRNLLRMGVFEMMTVKTPAPVVLDECIELARSFGSQQSAAFVNGVLDKLIPKAPA